MPKKNIPDSGFSGDDGSPDPGLAAALAAWAKDPADEKPVLDALRTARLLVPVVAVLGELEEPADTAHTGEAPDTVRTTDAADTSEAADATGTVRGAESGIARPGWRGAALPREKTSDMAVPTLRAGGRTALPAFTSTAALARWDPDARPVAVRLHQALKAAAHERADTLVLDLAGPVPYELTGAALRGLAEGRAAVDPLGDPEVREAVRAAVAAEPAVASAHLGPGSADGTLAVVLDPGTGPAAQQALGALARRLAADETLRARLVHGLDLAALPAGTRPPGTPLYERPRAHGGDG